MIERHAEEFGDDPVAMAALNECIEAWLEVVGRRESRAFLRTLRRRSKSPIGSAAVLLARGWLRLRHSSWLARFG